MMGNRRIVLLACACFAILQMSLTERASAAEPAYPSKPIRLLVAAAPGGPNDVMARIVAPAWGEALGGTIVVDNRAGAAGMIGTEIAARAAPDGYTLLVGYLGPLIIAPLLGEKAGYDSLKDFAPISLAVSAPFVLLVNPSVPAKSLQDLVALAKSRAGKLNYASGGIGQSSHMAMELLKVVAGIDLVHVPYKGAGPAMTATLAAEVDATFAAIPAAMPHLRAEKLRGLAVGGARRSSLLPDLPTIRESGYAVDATSWYGMLAPRAVPAPVLARLHSTLTATLNAPAMRKRLVDIGFEVNASSPEEFMSHLRAEMATWRKVIAASGLRRE